MDQIAMMVVVARKYVCVALCRFVAKVKIPRNKEKSPAKKGTTN